MLKINRLELIRLDGIAISETTTIEEMIALSRLPSKVKGVRWFDGPNPVRLNFKYGVDATVVAGGNHVVWIEELDEMGQSCELLVVNSDGSRHIIIPNIQQLRGRTVIGEFRWFEPPRSRSTGVFGVIFSEKHGMLECQLDIDAKSGHVIGFYPTH